MPENGRRAMKEFDHVGIVTTEPQMGESWVEFSNP
jgi:hypothetical protein